MKALNRNREVLAGFSMRGERAQIVSLLTALALSGCVQTAAPVAPLQPRNDLDSMAYGLPYPAPATPAPSRTG
jgi:polysaccharide export outer membrane protein